ncbi:Crp/Fnr family transcriptional regulator [Oscillatoriales cyanobacterium LEGE 11467]|uniref:Crp/Fnr family transcriptional regulator n=1 Tax=Zarconia navalis LEGE 11467 TaxID=1828826 RepID=A0A928Z9X9_9CYAN|nr:Crp/Fnr family transcriptional regulator [Zarconia navalis]MBE9042219.1 Crp/Fnr family transcriptional regulator [Zarconia navalis LEGE 11467]
MLARDRFIPNTVELTSNGQRTWTNYERGDIIHLRNGGMWQVCRGWVQMSTFSIEGRERVLGWLGSSMWLGDGLHARPQYRAKALSDVKLVWYSSVEIEVSPHLRSSIVLQLSWRQRQLLELVAAIQRRRVEERLRHVLILLAQEMGQPVREGTRLGVRLTHLDLANVVGTCRVSATRILNQLKNQGLISWDRQRHLIIHDRTLL